LERKSRSGTFFEGPGHIIFIALVVELKQKTAGQPEALHYSQRDQNNEWSSLVKIDSVNLSRMILASRNNHDLMANPD
jgi:hypothetical protein